MDLDEELADEGKSAYRGKHMAAGGALAEFIDRVRRGEIEPGSVLLIENLDRFSRQKPIIAAGKLQELCTLGITVVTLQNGKTYTDESLGTIESALVAIVELALAHEESAKKARRLKAVWENKRAKAMEKPLSARCPGWLVLRNGRFEIIQERAEIVRRIFGDTLQGCSPHSLAEALNVECVPVFGRGRHWHRSYIVKLLASKAVVGTYVPYSESHEDTGKLKRTALDPIPNYYPPIIDADTFNRVQALRMAARGPMTGRHAGQAVSNIFGGVARCGRCGGTMTRVNKGGGQWVYLLCTQARYGAGCVYELIPYAKTERALIDNAGQILGPIPAGERAGNLDEQIISTESLVQALGERIENLVTSSEQSPSLAYARRISEIETERDAAKAQLDELLTRRAAVSPKFVHAKAKQLATLLRKSPLDRTAANALIRQLFSEVTVDPDHGLLVFEWQQGGTTDAVYGWPRERTGKPGRPPKQPRRTV